MNIKEYIESGVLELYIAGTLTAEENTEVRNNAAQYPEIAEEIAAIETAFNKYASAFAKAPSQRVLQNILTELQIESTESRQKLEPKIVQMKPAATTSNKLLKYLAYAAVALLFVSGSLNVYYFNKYKNTQNELASLQGEKEYLAGQYNTMKASYDAVAGEMNIMKSPGNIAITLKGSAIQPDAIATVYWNKKSGSLYLNVNNLPVPPGGKQYQLWALKDGKPIDAGVFTMRTDLQTMKTISAADAFAVTLEPAGGSVAPSLEFLYVIGTV